MVKTYIPSLVIFFMAIYNIAAFLYTDSALNAASAIFILILLIFSLRLNAATAKSIKAREEILKSMSYRSK